MVTFLGLVVFFFGLVIYALGAESREKRAQERVAKIRDEALACMRAEMAEEAAQRDRRRRLFAD